MTPAAPTIGRIIYVESNLWKGVRPAVIVDVTNLETNPTVRANVLLDGTKDSATLQFFRSRPEGNTVTLEHGVLNPGDPCSTPSDRDYFLGSWMPFQVGQAPASLIVQGELSAATKSIARLVASLSELEAKVDGRHTMVGDSLSLIQEDLSEQQSKLSTLLTMFNEFLATKVIQVDQPVSAPGVVVPPNAVCLTIDQAALFFESLPAGGIGSVMCRKPDGSWLQAMNLAQATDFFTDEPHQPGNPAGTMPPAEPTAGTTEPVTQTSTA